MNREHFLERIRAAYRGDVTPAPVDLPVLPSPQTGADPVALFVDRARQLGMGIELVSSMDEAARHAAAWGAERGVHRVAAWDIPDLAPVVGRFRAAGMEILTPGASVEALAQADIGITGAEWGIAETATLVLASAPAQPRLVSLLPPVHLAVLRADRIVPDLPALFAQCGSLPSALTFITGPSRSADIGLTPVLGAHGPTAVAVLLVAG